MKEHQQIARQAGGPKTMRGKARSKLNATTHGLTATAVVIAGEDLTAYTKLMRQLVREWAPQGSVEVFLVGRLGSSIWRIWRIQALEAGVLTLDPARSNPTWAELSRDFARRERAKKLNGAAFEDSDEPSASARTSQAAIARRIACEPEFAANLVRLSSYEAHLDRLFFRTHRELQQIQASRTRRGLMDQSAKVQEK